MANSGNLAKETEPEAGRMSQQLTGAALRRKFIANISSILDECEEIPNSICRLAIQSNCLDLLSNLEEMIEDLGLDR